MTFVVLCGSAFFIVKKRTQKIHLLTFRNEEYRLSFSYPSNFQVTPLSEKQNEEYFLFRSVREQPSALISLRYEKGLGVLKLTGGSILDSLINGVNRRYPERFPEFKKTKFEEKVVGNEKSALFEFTYLGTDKSTRMKQRLIIISKDNNVFYLSMQSTEAEFEKSIQDFNEIERTFTFL
ncbi:hypothetical protein COY33_01745 [candidate division WWE3 bacterium CG_4_10_14_0_2_um_filter_42_7]|uniref:PsbP C-terminal domain-containing protein n=2 Tax=Katanobacteria TaxID=422282 RepID=A0A2H0X8R4_UNCKA|nr:MAG: hypothetical protein COT51_03355 [candidate division WWE3 bacterium CG08_land_8_20_14_0_20_41_15]PIZ43303.1 MAG: hypothetical protein COY33_01745 [candidate division WWE3 bacterium CG_4_10_14_0_2_um_filter_42_7]